MCQIEANPDVTGTGVRKFIFIRPIRIKETYILIYRLEYTDPRLYLRLMSRLRHSRNCDAICY